MKTLSRDVCSAKIRSRERPMSAACRAFGTAIALLLGGSARSGSADPVGGTGDNWRAPPTFSNAPTKTQLAGELPVATRQPALGGLKPDAALLNFLFDRSGIGCYILPNRPLARGDKR